MSKKEHVILIFIALLAWSVFYLIGLPSNYYQEWSTAEQILLSLVTFFAALPLIAFVSMVIIGHSYIKVGIWLAFYGSLILLLLDSVIVGIIRKHGMRFLMTHWYVTIGYIYVWIMLPGLSFILTKFKEQLLKK